MIRQDVIQTCNLESSGNFRCYSWSVLLPLCVAHFSKTQSNVAVRSSGCFLISDASPSSADKSLSSKHT
eukprot:4614118-Amphidinium_carterae.1